MRVQVLTGLFVLLAGCLVKRQEPVTEEKSLGRALENLGKNIDQSVFGAKIGGDFELKSLSRKLLDDSLAKDEIEELASLVIRSKQAIETFKAPALGKLESIYKSLRRSQEVLIKAVYGMPVSVQDEFLKLLTSGKEKAAAELLKKNAELPGVRRAAFFYGDYLQYHLKHQNELFSRIDKIIAANHSAADSVADVFRSESRAADRLKNILKRTGLTPKQLADEMKIVDRDFKLFTIYPAEVTKNQLRSFNKFLGDMIN